MGRGGLVGAVQQQCSVIPALTHGRATWASFLGRGIRPSDVAKKCFRVTDLHRIDQVLYTICRLFERAKTPVTILLRRRRMAMCNSEKAKGNVRNSCLHTTREARAQIATYKVTESKLVRFLII